MDFRIPSTGSAAEQQQILDDLVAKGVDGIAVSPIDPKNQTDFLNKIAAATLLITCDSDAVDSKRVCYIGTDNFAAGVEAGKLIKEALPNGGKISLRGGEGSVIGIVIGTALLLVLQNLVNLLGIPSSLNFAVMGVVVLFGVLADQMFKNRTARKSGSAAK